MLLKRGLGFAAVVVCVAAGWADYDERPAVRDYIAEVVAQHGFEKSALETLFQAAERKEAILAAMSRPAERKRWHEYRKIFVTPTRIREGIAFWRANEETLRRVERVYNVPPEITVAVVGVETRYGRNLGSFRVLDSLSTLAFDYPPRATFFLGELTEFLLLAQEEGIDPLTMKGSYAGAMGYGQFIPSSYRNFAVDFDGDGTRDIWTNLNDALGSIGNYFAEHGWRGDGPAAMRVEVAGRVADEDVNRGLMPDYDEDQLKRLGVISDGMPPGAKAALFRMEGDEGAEYWLGLHDFYVITRYNHSRLYALAVWQLGQAIRSGKERSERVAMAAGEGAD
ncbi:MAG: lytic murein transglycosylase B [Gammaproteobacteria bacterium]|nr:lytic murein transglycosylase B [Gammaproteobacteria bacterium]